ARGSARRLRGGDLQPDALLEIVESIAAQAVRAGAVLRRIRDFVRHHELPRERVDLSTLVREAVRFGVGEARQLGIALRVEPTPAPLEVEVDVVQIEQVILNLVRNAFEATTGRLEGAREVTIRSARSAAGAEVTVSDTGAGVPPEAAGRLFEPFFTTKRDGLGLGLSISRSIVEAHGGKLWGAPNTPRGATFPPGLPSPRRPPGGAASRAGDGERGGGGDGAEVEAGAGEVAAQAHCSRVDQVYDRGEHLGFGLREFAHCVHELQQGGSSLHCSCLPARHIGCVFSQGRCHLFAWVIRRPIEGPGPERCLLGGTLGRIVATRG